MGTQKTPYVEYRQILKFFNSKKFHATPHGHVSWSSDMSKVVWNTHNLAAETYVVWNKTERPEAVAVSN
jgi:hypothetical protein